jgi:hypothetical protein
MIAWISAVVVALLLFVPIRILAPGDHEKRSCGNALSMDIVAWRVAADGGETYYEQAFRGCTEGRVDRLAKATAVISVTVPVLAFVYLRRRPDPDGG